MIHPSKTFSTPSDPDKASGSQGPLTRQLAPSVDWSDLGQSDHFVQFYEMDTFLLESISDFIGAGLGSGAACIVIATPPHRQGLSQRLQANGLDLLSAHVRGKYVAVDAAETLAQCLRGGSLDHELFARTVGSLIKQVEKGQKRIRIFGEMVALLWQQDNPETALLLETFWNELHSTAHPFSLFCAYPMSLFAGQKHLQAFTQVCDVHAQVIPNESYSRLTNPDERLRAISLFQQKALSLEAEIAERRAAEEHLRLSENRYRRLFEASSDGILLVDAHRGLITDANPRALELLDSTREQVLNQPLWQLGLFQDQEANLDVLHALQEHQVLCYEELSLHTRERKLHIVEFVSTPYQADGHQVIQCTLRDITDRKQAEEARLYLAAIVESSDDAILSKDLDGVITRWNAAAERMYGYSAQEIIGQPVTQIFPPDGQEEFRQIMERIRQGERMDHYETRRVCKDGSVLTVSVTVSPIKDSHGTIIGASAIARDVSEQKALEQQREAFVGLVTHELKNPLTSLQGNIQLARRRLTRLLSQAEQLEEGTRQAMEAVLTMLSRSQQQLWVEQRLINDLLDISSLQQGKLELRFTSFNLVELVYETVQSYQAAHPSRLITLDLPEQEPIPVYADRDRVQQVLSNYLTNALKFAPVPEPIQVRMVLKEAMVRVQVQDRGPGISLQQQARIWQQFYQGSQTMVQNGWKVGLGMGLYVCQQLMHRQQGEVGVESKKGKGATFWFALPVHTHFGSQ